MFFQALLELGASKGTPAELARAAGIEERRYSAFRDYPMKDNLLLTVEVAQRVYPRMALADALTRIGETSFSTFLASHLGRVLVLAAGSDVGPVLTLAPRAYPLVMNFGSIEVETTEPGRVVTRCRDLPAFIETYQVGTAQGVLKHFGVRGTVLVDLEDIANGRIEVTW
jgi:uncharacterized protein (TIGR02265 family)